MIDILNRPTRGDNILDHILVSHDLREVYDESLVSYDCPVGRSDHLMITCRPSRNDPVKGFLRYSCVLDLRNSNISSLVSAANAVNWSEVVSQDANVNTQWNSFLNCLHQLVQENIPKHTVCMTDNDKEWMTPLTKHLIQERWNAYRMQQWDKYNHLKEKVKKEIKRAKAIWANKMKRSTNGLWKLVSNIRGNTSRDPLDSLVSEFESVDGLLDVLHAKLSESFSADSATTLQAPGACEDDDDWNIEVNEYTVRTLLAKLPAGKAPGHDGIPSKIYRCLADVIACPLSLIFKNSISKRTVPLAWKKGVIIPIPKTKPASVDKLRYITLLPVPLKILEKLVLRSIWKKFDSAYGVEQHGFRPCASTTTALLRLTDAAFKCLNEPSLFGIALMSFDLSKAFDTINCSLALQKMREAGFPSGFLQWLNNYFYNRTGVIKIQGKHSSEFILTRGVPQGSVLGPPIFCTYVSAIKSSLPGVTTVKYADDINLIVPLSSRDPAEIKKLVDSETSHISDLCTTNYLTLNEDKSKILFVTRRDIIFTDRPRLPQVKLMKLLGFIVNDKLNWSSHIEYVCKKSAQRLHILRKLRDLISFDELHLVYISLIRSLLEYASPVFVGLNKKLSKRLEKTDKRAHRIMNGCFAGPYNACSCRPHNIHNRRIAVSESLFRSIEDSASHPLLSCVPIRLSKSGKLLIPCAKYVKYHNSFFPFMARHLNL